MMLAWVKTAILAHVQRGAGLVYVSPNRLQRGQRPTAEVAGEHAEFTRLFETDAPDELVHQVFDALPMDALPLDLESDPEAARGDSTDGNRWKTERARVRLSSSQHGEGRILGLDYHDEMVAYRNSASLTPYVYDPEGDHDVVLYDFYHLLLARCLLWTVDRLPQPPADAIDIPATLARLDTMEFDHQVRDRAGNPVTHRTLPRGEYFVDKGLGSRSLRVETDQRVTDIRLHAQDGSHEGWIDGEGAVDGTFTTAGPLADGQSVRVGAIDTWGRIVAKANVEADRNQFTLTDCQVGLHGRYSGKIRPGSTYRFSLALKGKGVFQFRVWVQGINIESGERKWLGFPDVIEIDATESWKTHDGTFKHPRFDDQEFRLPHAVSAAIVIDAGDRIYLDDFLIEEDHPTGRK